MRKLPSAAPSRQRTIITWVLMIIAAMIFMMAAFSKITQTEQMATVFNGFSLPLLFVIIGSIALVVGAIAFLAGLGLMGIIGSAFITHMPSGNSIGSATLAIAGFVLVAIVTWLRGSNFAHTASNISGN